MASQRTLYDVLGVTPGASTEQIRAAFRKLARERHPDRFQGSARAAAERAFQEITEAYNVLSDPGQRSRYDRQLESSHKETLTDPKEIAKALLGRALSSMKAGQHALADEAFIQAIAHDPQSARAHHLYGMFLAQQPTRLDEALRHLDQAAKIDPNNPKILLDASRLFARANMNQRALRLAQAAARLVPDDDSAQSWLRQLQAGNGREGRS
ncbi:MAG TPA: DnaJ domain-containing protein [Thermoanaerobaculaceae bacterium]|nr:DnaJ domain-containing protein [Thermoanaerobaculaceae bacterium]HRS16733.1 DnaJ domain-containing protein [Thermoanaerobaculaceae bacterium]